MNMMRFERLWSTEGRFLHWPLDFKHLWFFFRGGTAWSPSTCPPRTDIQPLWSFAPRKAVGYQRLYRTTVRLCSSHTHRPELSSFRTEGMLLMRLFRNDCRVISQVRLRSARLCGKGDYCLLSVLIKSAAVCSATPSTGSRGKAEEWQLTFTRRTTKAPDQLQN